MQIGFIGQGFVGKSYADEFENRGMPVTRYALEPEYAGNKDKIKDCDIVFIAVPTPTTPKGFDYSIIESVLPLVGTGKTAVIRSTLLPGTTEIIQKKFPQLIILHAPEFLSEVVAGFEVARPIMNIVGYPANSAPHREQTTMVLSMMPQARFSFVMTSREAELMKYTHNIHGFMRVIYTNILYDLSEKLGCDWGKIQAAMEADPMMSPFYNKPLHKTGRGAGGHCFIKDFAAFRGMYEKTVNDPLNIAILKSLEEKNLQLLRDSNKDQDLVEGVYGKNKKAA